MGAPHTQGLRVVRVLWLLLGLVALIGTPFAAYELHHHGEETHIVGWFVALVFVFITVPVSLFDISLHLRYMHNPALQIPIIRVLWMVPIYSIDSYLALRFKEVAIYFDTAREAYEAYVIYSFTVFLVRFCALRNRSSEEIAEIGIDQGKIEQKLKETLSSKPRHKHLVPFCFLRPWEMTGDCQFYNNVKKGVAQYVVLRLLTAGTAMVLEHFHLYEEGNLSPDTAYFWLTLVTNFSQMWAMYCLVLFYHVMHDELQPMKPLAKFLSVKAVVFFSFWQAVVIALLVRVGVIKQNPLWTEYTVENVATGLQNFIICLEMLIAACVHHKIFSYTARYLGPLPGGERVAVSWIESFRNLFYVSDVAGDVYYVTDDATRELHHTVRDGVVTVAKTPSRVSNKIFGFVSSPGQDQDRHQNEFLVPAEPANITPLSNGSSCDSDQHLLSGS